MLTSNTFAKGMNTDVHPKFQPEGTYRFALNAVLETELGELPAIANELGNQICAEGYPTDKVLIGHSLTDNEDIILFLFDPTTPRPEHEIGIYNPVNCSYVTKAKGECLNFSDKFPINAITRIRNGCERVTNFTDNNETYRIINTTDLTGVVDANANIINCDYFQYTRDVTHPCVRVVLADAGDAGIGEGTGSLEVGTYSFVPRYLDKEFNPTDWLMPTRSVPVADEPYTYTRAQGTVTLYDGASNNPESDYYVPKTNKYIKLQILNQDTAFSYIQFAVIKRTSDDGTISGVDVLYPIPIPSANGFIYSYTGQESQIQSTTTIQDILAERQRIDTVAAHAFVDNRTMLGGVTSDTYDYSQYQKFATKIKVEWEKTPINNPVNSWNKQAAYYVQNASLMENEVYALSINYIHDTGKISPAFNIVGRAPDVVPGNADNPHIGTGGVATDTKAWDTGVTLYGDLWAQNKTKRWQNTSTALSYGSGVLKGLMGYWETASEKYPSITTCNDTPDTYWGSDWQGNVITPNTKIRHHRMPGPELTTGTTNAGYRTGIIFSNVEYPDSSIVGHFFSYGDRSNDKTILAKGLLVPLFNNDPTTSKRVFDASSIIPDQTSYNYPDAPTPSTFTDRQYAFITAEGQFKDYYFHPTYITVEKILMENEYATSSGASNVKTNISDVVIDVEHGKHFERDVTSNIFSYDRYTSPSNKNYKIDYSAWVPKAAYGNKFGTTIYDPIRNNSVINNSINLNFQLASTMGTPALLIKDDVNNWLYKDRIMYGSLRVDSDPFAKLEEIKYLRMNSCPSKATSTSNTFTFYGGDTFLARNNWVDTSYTQTGTEASGVTLDTDVYFTSYLTEESGMNPEFRHGSPREERKYYFHFNYQYDHAKLRDYLNTKVYSLFEDTERAEDKYIFVQSPEVYEYNDSFSYMNAISNYYSIPFGYEFCKDCAESFPYRVYYTELDNQEDSADKSRIIYPNNYRDLDGGTGSITDMFLAFDQLYITTTNSIFFIPTKAQQITSDESTIYLGTGEVLALAPRQLKTTEFAFGGQRIFKSRVSTEYGTFYVDDQSSRPFLVSNQLNDLSNTGMRSFWQENGRVEFLDQFYKITGTRYPVKTTTSHIGVGYISTYDPRYKRILVHKKDFRLLPNYEFNLVYFPQASDTPLVDGNTDPSAIWFNNFNFYLNDASGVPTVINFDNTTYFQNNSFTTSYSFATNSWVSFHSYLPSYMFNGFDNFYSTGEFAPGLQSLFKHNALTYQTYYGIKYDHIIDLIAVQNPQEIKFGNGIQYHSNTYFKEASTSGNYKWIPDSTFNGMIAYNSTQSTGYQDLLLKDGMFQMDNANDSAYVRRTDRIYRINNLRDRIVNNNQPIWDSSWGALQSTPFSYIDKVPYEANLDNNNFMYESQRLRDYYMGLRLFFNPPEDYKIVTDIVNTTYSNKNR
jgi:hypothetical protein